MSVASILSPQDVIADLYQQLCHYQSTHLDGFDVDNKIGMLFTVRVDCSNHGFEKDGNTYHEEWERHHREYLHIIITRMHQVFVARSSQHCWKDVDPSEYKNTSNHDSCWRTDGLNEITKAYFASWEACYKTQDPPIPDGHLKAPIAAKISGRLDSTFGSNVIRFVKIESR